MTKLLRPGAMRRAFAFLHRWLGLLSGAVVLLVSLTGALYVFEKEIGALAKPAPRSDPAHGPLQAPSALLEAAKEVLGPGRRVDYVQAPLQGGGVWSFRSRETDETAVTYFGWIRHDIEVLVDPRGARVVRVDDLETDFFQLVKFLHWSLLLRTEYGQPVVGWSVAAFLALLVSGLWLWRPRSLGQLRAKLVPRLGGPWRNRLWSWHAVLGAWVSPVAAILALTGLVWAFRPVMAALYVAAAWTTTPPDMSSPESARGLPSASIGTVLDTVHATTARRHPGATSVWYFLPSADTGTQALGSMVRHSEEVYWDSHREAHDRNTGRLLQSRSFRDGNRGERLIAMNYDIHVGAALGLPGKILAFLASLLCASLPVSGFLMWRGRLRRGAAAPPVSHPR